ncbi:MAG: hypothetical protein R3C26_11960 [Calditrichia bacterium]
MLGAKYRCALATDGRLIILATMGGGKGDSLDLRKILVKRLRIIGTTLRARDLEYKQQLTNDFVRNILSVSKAHTEAGCPRILPWRQVKQLTG